jgi:hypothetical protein
MILFFSIMMVTIITVGAVTKDWLWSFLVLFIYFIITVIVTSFMKEYINSIYRAVHFVLAVHLRAENNKFFLRHGVELRPGYLGKWIEINTFKHKSRSKYLYSVEERIRL